MWVKCTYNWVVNAILSSLNFKELIFGNIGRSLYIKIDKLIVLLRKKKKDEYVSQKNKRSWFIVGMRRLFKYCMWHMDRLGRIWSAITKMKGSTNSAIIERQDILRFPVSITLLCIRVYIPFCQLIIIYHKLSQLLLICLQNIFEALKHSKVVHAANRHKLEN